MKRKMNEIPHINFFLQKPLRNFLFLTKCSNDDFFRKKTELFFKLYSNIFVLFLPLIFHLSLDFSRAISIKE